MYVGMSVVNVPVNRLEGRVAVYCSFTKTPAIPIPEPMHMLVTKILAPVSFAIE